MFLPYKQLNGIFTELVHKLSHTQIQEFFDSYKQSAAVKNRYIKWSEPEGWLARSSYEPQIDPINEVVTYFKQFNRPSMCV